ncbi:MAG: indole-3-glycerol phosphate synthase TrpC [Candidatus Desulfofervidus sp.]|nr:indole-3-glycerol phosphate synthase TrpC [Candidatus Desulfofervidus sp.]
MSVLDNIVAHKKKEIETLKKHKPLDETIINFDLYPKRSFSQAITHSEGISIIAEIKKASPSLGVIRADFEPLKIAKTYEENGASAISVITDKKFFQGDINFLPEIKTAVKLPILRKDFIIDPYQVYETKLYGADALLLISTVLSVQQLKKLLNLTHKLGMEALVEVHNEKDLEKALKIEAKIIGINNRNLNTLKVNLQTCLCLKEKVPEDKILVAESGIKTREDILLLEKAGFQAVLIGSALMQAQDIGKKLKEFLGK